jgi:N-acetylmuramoyl-L-alanine amidase
MEKIAKVKYLWLVLVFLSTLLSASPQILQKVEVKNGDLVLTFDREYNKKAIKYFPLSHPPRKVFDIPHTILSKQAKKTLSYNSSIRVAQYKKDTVRVVIETQKPYKCMTYRPLVDTNIYCIPLPKYKNRKKTTKSNPHPIKKTKSKKNKPKIKDVKVVPTRYTKDLIVIDPGHGGHDSGAIGGGKMEKHLVLQIAKRVKRHLRKMGYRVYLTRSNDRFLKLPQRTRVADRKGAKVFVSIHANSVPKRLRYKAYGVETYFLQKTRDAKSQRIAARENAAVLKGAKSTLSKKVIIDSVLNGPKIVQSTKLAIDVQRHIIYYLRQHYNGVKDGGVRPAPFYVLVGASRPSILVEVGYISHPKERRRLFSSSYQDYIAKGIAKGIDSYLRNRRKELDL